MEILTFDEDYLKTIKDQKLNCVCRVCRKSFSVKKETILFKKDILCSLCTRKQTNLKKFGVDNPFKNKEAVKKSYQEKLGVDNPSQSREVKNKKKSTFEKNNSRVKAVEKSKKTKLEKYGNENYNNTEKSRQTKLSLYHNKNYNNSAKIKKTWLEKDSNELEKIQDKRTRTCLEKYDKKYYQNTTEFKIQLKNNWKSRTREEIDSKLLKSKKTCLERYGKEYWTQTKTSHMTHRSKYFYDNVFFDSKPELAFYIYCKDHNLNIERNADSFEYFVEGKLHYYFPDFKIGDTYYEIKGDQFLDENTGWRNPYNLKDETFKFKYQCALRNNVTVLYEKDYRKYLDYIKETYDSNYLNLFRAKK